jgi:WD40 repeat protein
MVERRADGDMDGARKLHVLVKVGCFICSSWWLFAAQVIRNYHGHLSGVYCLALHPTLDLLMTGGRDSVCRVWDIRSKVQVFALSGHTNTVASVLAQAVDPQVGGGGGQKGVGGS